MSEGQNPGHSGLVSAERSSRGGGDLTAELVEANTWSDEAVGEAGIPIVDVPFITIGGGLGSLAMVDTLRIAGMASGDIRVLAGIERPEQTYKFLARNSQIPDAERLRSDSSSTIDNIWGFPSYGVREAFAANGFADKLRPLKQVLVEPVFDDFYTPRGGQVYDSVAREAERIGWERMRVSGLVRMVRKRHGGGYYTVLTPPEGASATKRIAFRSRFVHLSVGYPGLKILKDLQNYREAYNDFTRVVNAYDPHDHVYEGLIRRPGVVLVRGSGIVASRILQRLIDDRDRRGAQTTIVHLFRNYVAGPQGDDPKARRDGGLGFAYQAFNFPKAAWGGQLKRSFEALPGSERASLLGKIGGTNTPKRRDWQEQLIRGQSEGFYRQHIGQVSSVVPGAEQAITTTIVDTNGQQVELSANFIIDATGLESDISEHRLLADLLEHGGAQRNPYGRLEVEPTFEVTGTRADPGRLYASGSPTLGGYYAGVDSFLGLQYAALQIADDLARQQVVRKIGPGRSVREWWRWVRGELIPG